MGSLIEDPCYTERQLLWAQTHPMGQGRGRLGVRSKGLDARLPQGWMDEARSAPNVNALTATKSSTFRAKCVQAALPCPGIAGFASFPLRGNEPA